MAYGFIIGIFAFVYRGKILAKITASARASTYRRIHAKRGVLRLQRQLESGFDVQLVARSNRLLFIRQGVQQAAIILDDEAVMPERFLDQVLLLSLPTTFNQADVLVAKAKIHAHLANLG